MKNLFILFLLLMIFSCTSSKNVYWCGDHPCINKKEKEAYFKKTMIVEVRNYDKNKMKEDSEIEKLLNQAQLDEKKRILTEKEIKKRTRMEEKELAKQIKLDEKRRIKEEKDLAKKTKNEEKSKINANIAEKKVVKLDKKKSNKDKVVIIESHIENVEISTDKFDDLVKKILERNTPRPYPDINDIPK